MSTSGRAENPQAQLFTVLDNSNIVESYPGITLPLTYSFIKIAYKGVFKGLIGAQVKNDSIMAKYETVFDNMVQSYQGRIYYCLNNWYSLIDFMPFSKQFIPIWQDMMGVKNSEVYRQACHRFTGLQKVKMTAHMLKSLFSVSRDMVRLEDSFAEVQKHFADTYRENLSRTELQALFRMIEARLLERWHVTLVNDVYAFVWTGLLKKKLARGGSDVTHSLSGITGLESLKPVRTLLALAQEHGEKPALLALPAVQDYLATYGDRSPQELKLECLSYRECPELLEKQIRIYAQDKDKLNQMIEALDTQRDAHAQAKTGFLAKRALRGIANRETSRLNRSRIYGMVRRIFIHIGKQAFGEDWFDVFYLTVDEVFAGNFNKELVKKRKAEYADYETREAPTRLLSRGDTLIEESVAQHWTGSFKGTGTSQGIYQGEALVLSEPHADVEVQGKIIVTKTTDPGWAFLLCRAGGIVAEKGSLLSHTAIVSRELKIPAVVGVENATALIKTGDSIRINGDDGTVEIVEAR